MSSLDPTTDPSTITPFSDDGAPMPIPPAPGPTSSFSAPSKNASSTSTSGPAATGLRQRVNKLGSQLDKATEHPVVKNAKTAAAKEVKWLREVLGRSAAVRDLESKTGVDRVALVVGGALLYLVLIPLNLFGLALPTTTLLTLLPSAYLAIGVLDLPPSPANEAATKSLLAYFVVLGFIHFLESLAAGVLSRRIPQYYTVKLVFLAYLLHPRFKGAMLIHDKVLKPMMTTTAQVVEITTPPTTKVGDSPAASPTFGSGSAPTNGSRSASGTFGASEIAEGGDEDGNLTKGDAAGEAFEVVSEAH